MWFSVLAGPSAWVLQLYVGAYLTDVLCLPGANGHAGHVYSLANTLFVAFLTAGTAIVALAGVLVSALTVRRIKGAGDPTPERRALWMARCGVIVNLLFLFLIVLMFAASYYLEECSHSL